MSDSTMHVDNGLVASNTSSVSANGFTTEQIVEYLPVGLVNFGNQCYLNSTLQCLRRVTEFRKYFCNDPDIERKMREQPNLLRQFPLVQQFLLFFFNVQRRCLTLPRPIYKARALKNVVGRLEDRFDNYSEQDAEELLLFFFDRLHQELNQPLGDNDDGACSVEKLGPTAAALNMALQHDRDWRTFLRSNRSIIIDLFYGQYQSLVKCAACGHESRTYDPFHSISLELRTRQQREADQEFERLGDQQRQRRRRVINVYVFLYSTRKRKCICTIDVGPGETAGSIIDRITERVDMMSSKYSLMVHIYERSIRKLFNNDDTLDGYTNNDMLCIYQLVPPTQLKRIEASVDNDDKYVIVCLTNTLDKTFSSIGFPEFMLVPSSISANELYRRVEEKMILVVENTAPERFNLLRELHYETKSNAQSSSSSKPMSPMESYFRDHRRRKLDDQRNDFMFTLSLLTGTVEDRRPNQVCDAADDSSSGNNEDDDNDDGVEMMDSTQANMMELDKNDEEVIELFPPGQDVYFLYAKWAGSSMNRYIFIRRCIEACSNESNFTSEDFVDHEAMAFESPLLSSSMAHRSSNASSARKPVSVDLYEYLQEHVADEVLDGDNAYQCSNCCMGADANKRCRAIKQLSFARLPSTLVIHLKRFKYNMYGQIQAKIRTPVYYQMELLDLSPYVTRLADGRPATESAKYRLVASVNHYGTTDSGHYRATCRSERNDESWVHYDDTEVSPIDRKSVVAVGGYILFYERKE